MNNTLHTGGEWYAERIHIMKDETPHDHDIWAVYSTQRSRYVDKPQDICSFNWRTPAGKANAHLISAAPDLLSALEEMMSVFQDHEQYDEDSAEVISFARVAIAKAKGEA